ncbi:protein UL13 [Cercopithecine betaherpesvirus 5]|uniref:Protein UL13 n=1 Tax=Simian cytomegalovirus (strain Colburn) TaxID=50292 RepID=G8XTS0_SCMVC|nr:protein UL13 [Cercopithecine betaherpesvirus 5]
MARHRCHKYWLLWLSVILGSWISLVNALEIVDECSEEQSIMQAAMRQVAVRLAAAPVRSRRTSVDGRPPSIPSYLDVRSPRPPRHRHDEDPVSANLRWQQEQMQFFLGVQRSRMQSRPWIPPGPPPAVRLPVQFARHTLGYGPVPDLPALALAEAPPMPAAAVDEESRVVIVRNNRPPNAGPGPRLPHQRRNALTFTGSTDSLDLARLRLYHEQSHRELAYRWKHCPRKRALRTKSVCAVPPRPPTISEPMEFRPAPSPEPPRRRTLSDRMRNGCRALLRKRKKDDHRHRWHVRRHSAPTSIFQEDIGDEPKRPTLLSRTHSWFQHRLSIHHHVWRLRRSTRNEESLITPLSAHFTRGVASRSSASRSRPPSPSESVTVNIQTGEVTVIASDEERMQRNEQEHVLASRQMCRPDSTETLQTCTGETSPRRTLLGTSLGLWLSSHWLHHHRRS